MANCSDKECKENIQKDITRLFKTLYGEDGTGGVVSCVKQKVSTTSIRTYFFAILTLFVTFMGYGVNAWSDAREERAENSSNIKVIQTNLEAMQHTVEEIKEAQEKLTESQKEMLEKLGPLNQEKLLEEIRRIVEEK
jgi:hypothetical protein